MGMIARDEESSIGLSLKSLFQQSIFLDTGLDVAEIRICVLANGCSDGTAQVARSAIAEYAPAQPGCKISTRVVEYELGDKGMTWNRFVHEISDADSDYLFMLDADIVIDNAETCELIIAALEDNKEAVLSGAVAIKDLAMKENKSLMDKVSLSMTRLEHNVRFSSLAGALLCGRNGFFRKIWLPKNMLNIDGFFTTLAKTDFFTHTELMHHRVINPEGATFVFEAYTNFRLLYNNHCRRFIGLAIWNHINKQLFQQGSEHGDVSEYLRERYEQDQNWLQSEIIRLSGEQGTSLVPWGAVTMRLRQYRVSKKEDRSVSFPVIVLATIWQFAVMLGVNYYLKKGDLGLVWKNSRNTRLVDTEKSIQT